MIAVLLLQWEQLLTVPTVLTVNPTTLSIYSIALTFHYVGIDLIAIYSDPAAGLCIQTPLHRVYIYSKKVVMIVYIQHRL